MEPLNKDELWQLTLPMLEKLMTQVVFDSQILPLTPISYENNILTLMVEKHFHKDTIKIRYFHDITRCMRTVSGNDDIELHIVSPQDFTKENNTRVKIYDYNYEKTNLRKKYVFETFVKGKCNEFAYGVALNIAENPKANSFNPLFLYGGVGLGKTHLAQSIGNRALELFPELKVVYVSSETFTNEFITSIREQSTAQFKEKYRKVDILLIDDIQFLEGKNETQEEMFHTFNDLYNANKQIVLTSDLPPKELTGLEARLTSRFSAGVQADVNIPDYETRTAILEKKLHSEKIELPPKVKDFITQNIVSNIRDLEGALNKIMAYANLTKTQITLELAEQALKDQLVNAIKQDITIEYIQQVVAAHFRVSVEDLTGRKRTQSIVLPRQIAMYLCRKIMDKSLPDVGKAFGGRDHSTVIHSCEKIGKEEEESDKMRILLEELERSIKGE